jgi:3-phenylpropionate/cinnamic acid dioxygenase small subunit
MHDRQVYGVFSDTLVRLASGLSGHCDKKQCGLAGLCFGGGTALDLRLYRVRTGVAGMVPDCNYQFGEEKNIQIKKSSLDDISMALNWSHKHLFFLKQVLNMVFYLYW